MVSNVFHKARIDVGNIFKKASGDNSIFKKASSFAHKVAGSIGEGSDFIGGVLRQAGNTLEKNQGVISSVAGATGFGSAIPAILSAGPAFKNLGAVAKRFGSTARNFNTQDNLASIGNKLKNR